jgi:hypothetical protein
VFACAVPLAAAVGYALATFQDAFRMMHLNSVFADWDSRMPRPALWVPTALVATLAAWVLYPRWNMRYTGREHCAVVGPLPLWLLGGAAALWAIRPLWTAPLHVGVAVDPVNGQAEPWGAGAWGRYHAPTWPAGLATVALLLSLGTGPAVRRTVRRSEQAPARLLVS